MGPMWERVFATGEATWSEDFLYVINRTLPREEGYFTFSYAPIRDDTGKVNGIFCTCFECTGRVIGERRLRTLRDLGQTVLTGKSAEEACQLAVETISENAADIPFALIYLVDPDGRARLIASTGIGADHVAAPAELIIGNSDDIANAWPFAKVAAMAAPELVTDLHRRFDPLPGGLWPESADSALVLPIVSGAQERSVGFLVAGLSPRRIIDADYCSFLGLLAGHIATAVSNARAYESERKRAEALAELDRAKTIFFSNVSHEFRTPLTLILAPLQDALAEVQDERQRNRLEMLQRNALRLQKLVNTLLDFSRIEAGRIRACFEPIDISTLTGELVSVFRSAIEKAGMRLVVNCQWLSEPIYVDREMYEKIVLNLLSNAFKFTLQGEIEVLLKDAGPAVRLSVRDTGAGIAEDELPHIFERFHRVEGLQARTLEGTGIGLALVQELVKLHGGTVGVQSVVGRGTVFSVTIPKGKDHLPADQVAAPRGLQSTALGADHYVQEALRWLSGETASPQAANAAALLDVQSLPIKTGARPRVIWADDNADMRDYVSKLLGTLYDVESFADGQSALAAVQRHPPDLVLADIMMPNLDGFELLKAVRANERTQFVPVILLSARAGEEARVEGLQAGADDYVVKPFTARELVGCVDAHLKLAQLQKEYRDRKDEFLATLAHELRNPLAPLLTGLHLLRMPGNRQESVEEMYDLMERQIRHLVRLVDDLMEVSRITRGNIELRKERLELASVIQSAIEISKPLIDAAQHELEVNLPAEPFLINADPVRLAQVFSNLLNNSAKYTEKGGRIWLTAYRENGSVVVSVRDNGMGIAAEMLSRVFDLFTQFRGSYLPQEGLGIGLTLVRRLVELHGGNVEAKSPGRGKGSEFLVRLPLVRKLAKPLDDRSTSGNLFELTRHRILVVDDNRDSADTLSLLLERLGAAVSTVYDGQAALEALKTLDPSAIFLDIGMPGMDGYELARRVRQEQDYRDVTLIACSGWGQEEDRARATAAGINQHLVKPIDLRALQKLLAEL